MIRISDRLAHLADMVSKDAVLADVGTDHGYIPIYLIQTGKIKKAFAMDIGKGPLLRAKEHIKNCGLGEYITLRLSDGLAALEPNEADAVLIAGMGGSVTIHILEEGQEIIPFLKELILQPQSEISKVREYLYQKGYCIDREDMVFEDGKYYPMMHITLAKTQDDFIDSLEEQQIFFRYGRRLLEDGHPLLRQYLIHIAGQYETIQDNLKKQKQTDAITGRLHQITEELDYVRKALKYWEEG